VKNCALGWRAWLGPRPPTPTTRVQIPATAPLFCVAFIQYEFNLSSTEGLCLNHSCRLPFFRNFQPHLPRAILGITISRGCQQQCVHIIRLVVQLFSFQRVVVSSTFQTRGLAAQFQTAASYETLTNYSSSQGIQQQ
jgi:hypothetical protein